MACKDDFEQLEANILTENVCRDYHSWTCLLGILKPVDGYGNEKDAPKGKGEDEKSNRCYSTPECFTVGCGRHLEPDLNSNCFIGS